MSISRITTSLVSGTNENTLALANFNIDFSLFKLEAPREFSGLGLALTRQRRELAEEGVVHRTARRLGALFENIVPNSPTLIRAYGSRVSEISQQTTKEDIPQQHGVFANCAGIDGTSVWAAATSGKSAISVHLLACMLARAWSGSQATSIWVEIVSARRALLKKQIEDGLYDSSAQLGLAVSEGLSRDDLAQWDASARAWLQVADDDQIRRQKQLMLIINNVNIPVNQGNARLTTYSRVIEAWKTALEALERLLTGQSQNISKGSVLLGLASWHLYPNLVVLGEKITTVPFHDSVIKDCGQLTIGLRDPDPDKDEGVYWSLSLAHLRFYGDPVKVTSFTTRDASRLSIDEFHLLVLGSILSDWDKSGNSDFTLGAEFFATLDECITAANCERQKLSCRIVPGLVVDWKFSWIKLLGNASRNFLLLKDTEKSIASNIMALGHRRGGSLLSNGVDKPPPMIGLGYAWTQRLLRHLVLSKRTDEAEESVEMLRFMAEKMGLSHNLCIIRIRNGHRYKYTTAVPHRVHSGNRQPRPFHINWIETNVSPLEQFSCRCHALGHTCHEGNCHCLLQGRLCTRFCHLEEVESQPCPQCHMDGSNFRATLPGTAKISGCDNLATRQLFRYVNDNLFETLTDRSFKPFDWKLERHTSRKKAKATTSNDSLQYTIRLRTFAPVPYDTERGLCDCFDTNPGCPRPTFALIAGSRDNVGLFIRTDLDSKAERDRVHAALHLSQKDPPLSMREVTEMLKKGQIQSQSLLVYVDSLYKTRRIALPSFRKGLRIRLFEHDSFLRSLHAVSLATKTYRGLPGSTISTQLISSSLHNAYWLPNLECPHLTRQQKFSCVAMLESGSYNIHPGDLKDVLAMSSRNSIFVSRLLLDDPISAHHASDISRVLGNVGKSGMVLMVAPQAPRMRKADLDNFRFVTHATFDGKLEDSFKSTSLHLRFTEFEMAFNVGQRGAIDKDLCLVETLVQVFERDQWVADIDVLGLFDEANNLVLQNDIRCTGCSSRGNVLRRFISVDNWEELMDVPEGLGTVNVGIFRAHGNWLARLAAACVCLQKGYRTVINPTKSLCWHCFRRRDWGWREDMIRKSKRTTSREDDDETHEEREEDISDPDGSENYSDESEPSEYKRSPDLSDSEEALKAPSSPLLATSSGSSPEFPGISDDAGIFDDDPGYGSDNTVILRSDNEDEKGHYRRRRRVLPQICII